MANLSITNRCNRSCSYCFAAQTLSDGREPAREMSREEFLEALGFVVRSKIRELRLLGGEPTLHPDLPWMVEQAGNVGLRTLIFSNGLMPERVLGRLAQYPPERLGVLVNVNGPEERTEAETRTQRATLRALGPRAAPGFNIHRPGFDCSFLLDWIRELGLAKVIRLGLAHPIWGGENRHLAPKSYPEVGARLVELALEAGGQGVELSLDCGFVPCMFPPGAHEALGKAWHAVGRPCSPILDIFPGGRVVPCYPLSGRVEATLTPESNADSLRTELSRKLESYSGMGVFRECARCSWRENGRCHGGCLAAAGRRLRRTVPAAPLSPPEGSTHPEESRPGRWVIPYIDQPMGFWHELADQFGHEVAEVYFPLPAAVMPSGRPPQPVAGLEEFLRSGLFPVSAAANPVTLDEPVEKVAPVVVEALKRLHEEYGLAGVTVANLTLGERVRAALPGIPLAASVLMDISSPLQVVTLGEPFDVLVPASRVMRDREALRRLRKAFQGRIRLIVNEACLPGCPLRVQHFHEMAWGTEHPRSLCAGLLARNPWLRLTGAWVLPQHLHFFEGLCDQFKLSGRVTLRDPARYLKVLQAYLSGTALGPDEIGGGPASVDRPLHVSDDFYLQTLRCGRNCHECTVCRDYYAEATRMEP